MPLKVTPRVSIGLIADSLQKARKKSHSASSHTHHAARRVVPVLAGTGRGNILQQSCTATESGSRNAE